MDNEKRYKVLPESYQKAYPDVLKQNQFKAAQGEWNRVKTDRKIMKSFYSTFKRKLPNIRQLRYPCELNQKRYVNNFMQTNGGLTRIDLYDTIYLIQQSNV